MSNFESFPIKTKFRDELLEQLAELALRGGVLEIPGVGIEVIVEDKDV